MAREGEGVQFDSDPQGGFSALVPHRNRDHQTYGAVRRVHSFFPYNVTDARRVVEFLTTVRHSP